MPSSADESFARGLSALQAGQADKAERLFKKALRLQPRHVPALNLTSILLTQAKRYEEAEQYIKAAIRENATSDASYYNYGTILKALKRPEEALQQFTHAIALNGAIAENWNGRGEMLLEMDRSRESIADFDKALAINPSFVDALVNKARALADLEQPEEALKLAERATALQPNHALAWLARGRILNHLRRHQDAADAFSRALTLNADLSEAWLDLGSAYMKAKLYKDAVATFDRLLAVKPHDARAWHGRGEVLVELAARGDAAASYEKAIALDPQYAPVHHSMGWLHMVEGRIDEARRAFQKSIQLNPECGQFHWSLGSTKKFVADDADLVAMESAAAAASITKQERMFLDFGLGKAYADIGDHRRSFQHFLAGNAAERSMMKYDEGETLLQFDRLEKTFTTELIARKADPVRAPSSRPIFIVGMPRSGSTLVEQILSSHPAVEGVGEVGAFVDATIDVLAGSQDPGIKGAPYPDFVPALDGPTLRSIGENYIARINALAGSDRPRTADKMLNNFLNCGLIHLALPNAVILHTARNPIDTCTSIFSLRFEDKLGFAYDLAELGRYHKRYQRLMAHWHRVLPLGRILDVQYEDVVGDLEGQARRIVAHCGLPWDDRCLAFHKNERAVRTASVAQVRQPIYKSSVSRWRAYEEFLGPLLKELGIEATQSN